MNKLLILIALLIAAPVRAGEREWQPTLSGAFGVLRREGQISFGFGGDAVVAYSFLDWLSVQTQIGCTHFSDVEEIPDVQQSRGLAYSATRCHAIPMLQVSSSERLSPRLLRDFFVPSFALGLGYAVEHRGQRKEISQGMVSQTLVDNWVMGPELTAAAGAELRFAEQFSVGLRLRGTTPVGQDFGRSFEFAASLLATFLFYT